MLLSTHACYILHDDTEFLEASVRSLVGIGNVVLFVGRRGWNGTTGAWERAVELGKQLDTEVIVGDWADEAEHRSAVLAEMRARQARHFVIPDSDEVFEPALLGALLQIAAHDLADRVRVCVDTYWKDTSHVVRPREGFAPTVLLNAERVFHEFLREYGGGRELLLPPDYGVVHHLSYAGSAERIRKKLESTSHRDEVEPDWFRRVWQGWDTDPLMRNVHPTHPEAYGFIERIRTPKILRGVMPEVGLLERDETLPKVSVVIPVHGAAEHLRVCLEHLSPFASKLHEVIVVDNASEDDAVSVAAVHEFVTLIRNDFNLGFAAASNQGLVASSGEFVLFLNSDAYLTEAALSELCRTLVESGAIAAVGPYSNAVGHFQLTDVTYTSLETLPLFADSFARMDRDDVEIDMLVGFCLLCRKRVLDEIGGFDEQFGLGMFEDNDLCYRMRRAGYSIRICGRAFVHHVGSASIARAIPEPKALLEQNQGRFLAKWRDDLELGFASSLSGLSPNKIEFSEPNRPEKRRAQARKDAQRAKISLCMIVKNEERVLADCLKSAAPFFNEIIVVDTGSSDRTIDIALEHGAQVYEKPWEDSFSAARNESLAHANGDWIFWLDADDTLPFQSGEAILQAALYAPREIVGFVVPVQFVDGGRNSGTRVDHVKLFRRLPGIAFTLRIHEQILPSLQRHPGEIARCEAVVLHSGYDTSDEGQNLKRQRDAKLLALDLAENPGHPFVLFNLGMTHHFCAEHLLACDFLQQSIEKCTGTESHLRKAYVLLANSVRETTGPEGAIPILDEGQARVGWDPEILFQLGMCHAMVGNRNAAISAYEEIFTGCTTSFYTSYDISITGHKALYNLASLYLERGEYPEGRDRWKRALAESPDFLPSAFALFEAALQHQDFPTADEAAQHVRSVEGFSPNYLAMVEKLGESIGGPDAARRALEHQLAASGYAPESQLALAKWLLNHGRERDALPVLRALADGKSAEANYYLGVFHLRRNQRDLATRYFEQALALNPGHEQTIAQLDGLRKAQTES